MINLKEETKTKKVTKQTVVIALRQAGYSYEQTKNIRITEKEVNELVAVPAEGNELRTVKTQDNKTRTAVEISGGAYRIIKAVWISPQTKISDITNIIAELPKEDIKEAEQNFAIDILSKKFRLSRRGRN